MINSYPGTDFRIEMPLNSLPQSAHLTHPTYRPDIDGLRAIAIILVVGFHAFPLSVKGGFIGVDVFFVISGYLISTIIIEGLEQKSFRFTEFYIRRIGRIFPALIIVLATSLAFGWFVLLADEYKNIGKHIAGGASFVSNILLWNESGYFDNAAETKPLLHLWSLGIEEQFYIIWPLLLWFAWKLRLNLLKLAVIVGATSFALNIYEAKNDVTAAFYSPQTRFWELMAGSILAYMTLHRLSIFPNRLKHRLDAYLNSINNSLPLEINEKTLRNLRSALGAALIAFGLLVITKERQFPGWWGILPILGAVLIISAGAQAWLNRVVLSNRTLVWFGLISFPLYLWHWPLLSYALIIGGRTPDISIRIAAILTSIALAWVTYKFIEQPIRHTKKTYAMAIALAIPMFAVGFAGYLSFEGDGFGFRTAQQQSTVIATEFDYSSHWDGWEDCAYVQTNPGNGGCKILRADKPIDVAVIGDSHAGHLASGLRDIFRNRPENVAVMLHAGCFPFYTERVYGIEYFNCWGNLIGNALNLSTQSPTIRTVILSGYAALQIQIFRFHEANLINPVEEFANSKAFEAGLVNTLNKLTSVHKNVIYLIDNPELLEDPKSCISRPYFSSISTSGCSITRKQHERRNMLHRQIVSRVQGKFPSVTFIDSSNHFCDETRCFSFSDGSLLYATRDHLTPTGSKYLLNAIAPEIFNSISK